MPVLQVTDSVVSRLTVPSSFPGFECNVPGVGYLALRWIRVLNHALEYALCVEHVRHFGNAFVNL